MENGRLLGALKIAVLIPCYNEEASIQKVVADYKTASLPEATVYVCDNNSQGSNCDFGSGRVER